MGRRRLIAESVASKSKRTNTVRLLLDTIRSFYGTPTVVALARALAGGK